MHSTQTDPHMHRTRLLHRHKSTSHKKKDQMFASASTGSTQEWQHPPVLFYDSPSYHLNRSRRWFSGRSCRARRSQAAASTYSSLPSLHTPTHTVLLSGCTFTSSQAHQLFSLLLGHMECACTANLLQDIQQTHRHREKCWCRRLSCWSMSCLLVGKGGGFRLGYCRIELCLFFHQPLIVYITLQCNRYSGHCSGGIYLIQGKGRTHGWW